MKSDLINSLNIYGEAKKMVEEYLEELKIFIKKHNLDKDLYNDLEERLYEKLSEEKGIKISKAKVLKTIYEIGEPAEIFGVEDNESLLDKIDASKITEKSINLISSNYKNAKNLLEARKTINTYKKLIKNFAKKHNLSPEISDEIEDKIHEKLEKQKLSLNKKDIIKAIKQVGEPAELYEVKDKNSLIAELENYKNKNIINGLYNIVVNIFIKIKNIIFQIIKKIWGIFMKIWNNFMSSENIILKLIINITAFLYSSFGLIIFIIGIFGIGLIPIQFLDIGIDKMFYTRSMDFLLKIGLSLLALGTTALGVVIYKRVLSKISSLICVGLLFTFAFSLGTIGGINTIKNFAYKSTDYQEIVIPLEEGQESIILEKFDLYGNEYIVFDGQFEFYDTIFKQLPSNKNEIKIEIKNTIFTGNNDTSNDFFKNLNKIKYKLNGEKLTLYRDTNFTFKEPMKFTPLQRKVTIYAPTDLKISNNLRFSDSRDRTQITLPVSDDYKKQNESYYYNSCYNGIIKYNNKTSEFMCYNK